LTSTTTYDLGFDNVLATTSTVFVTKSAGIFDAGKFVEIEKIGILKLNHLKSNWNQKN